MQLRWVVLGVLMELAHKDAMWWHDVVHRVVVAHLRHHKCLFDDCPEHLHVDHVDINKVRWEQAPSLRIGTVAEPPFCINVNGRAYYPVPDVIGTWLTAIWSTVVRESMFLLSSLTSLASPAPRWHPHCAGAFLLPHAPPQAPVARGH
jgi:hypothetical protein